MSRTLHSRGKLQSESWWGKRPLRGHCISEKAGTDKWFKRLLHKRERSEGKMKVEEELDMEKTALSYFKELREEIPPQAQKTLILNESQWEDGALKELLTKKHPGVILVKSEEATSECPDELEFYGAGARMGGITGVKPKHKYTGKERE